MDDFSWNQWLHELHGMGIEIYPLSDIKEGVIYYDWAEPDAKAIDILQKMLKSMGIEEDLILERATEDIKQQVKELSKSIILE